MPLAKLAARQFRFQETARRGTLDFIGDDKPTTYIYNNTFNADGNQGSLKSDIYDIDAPGQPLDDMYKEYNVKSEGFQDYIMYIPPGSNSIAVPLAYFTWKWNVDVTDIPKPGTWELWGNASTSGSISSSGTATRQIIYPVWAAYVDKTNF